jgi:ATPase subunit of ABC transporter with duplicated ATPase domains
MLAYIYFQNPHLILFDEPTNHLDIQTIKSLITCIDKFNGAIVMVTHDIDLITKTKSNIYEITDNDIIIQTYKEYENKIIEENDLI